MIMSLRSNQRLLHTRQNLFCLRQRQPQIGDLGKAGGSIDLYQVDTICRDVGARFDQSQNPTHARSPGQKDKDKDRRIAPGPIPPISGQSPSLDGYTLIALDGTQYFCSNKLSCQNCSTRKHANGQIDYFHTVVAASVVKPSKNWVLPPRPEFIEPQQGYDKQDCESRAARRWLALNASRYSKLNPVYLGDDIYSKQPVCEEVLAVGAHFLFVCKPDSHKTMNEYLSGVEVYSRSRKVKRGKKFKILHLHLALDAGPADPRRQGCARGRLAGNHHPRFQRQDHLSQQLHHRSAGRRRQHRAPRRRRKGEVENRKRNFQHAENQGVQSRAQFRPRKKQPVGGPSHSQSDRLRNSPGRRTRRQDLESRHRSRRLQSPFLQQPARPDRLPAFSLMGQPPQNPRLSGRSAAPFMTLFQNENCCAREPHAHAWVLPLRPYQRDPSPASAPSSNNLSIIPLNLGG